MSWSINLYGPKKVLLREMAEAVAIINQAADSVESTESGEQDTFGASISGYVSWDANGVISAATNQNISVNRCTPPQAPAEDQPTAVNPAQPQQ